MRVITVLGLLLLSSSPLGAQQDMVFDDVEIRTTYGRAEEGDNGRLVVNAEKIQFVDGKGIAYFSVPSEAVTDLFYSRVSGRRIKSALFFSPLLLFSKGKKHYLTMSFDDQEDLVGAVEFRLDKSNYRGILRALEAVSETSVEFDQEGIKDEKETLAERNASPADASGTSRGEVGAASPSAPTRLESAPTDGNQDEISEVSPTKVAVQEGRVPFSAYPRASEYDGLIWTQLTLSGKQLFLAGLQAEGDYLIKSFRQHEVEYQPQMSPILAASRAERNRVEGCSKEVGDQFRKDLESLTLRNLTLENLSRGLDQFYLTPQNLRVPILEAIEFVRTSDSPQMLSTQ